jgi:hypothetical protein
VITESAMLEPLVLVLASRTSLIANIWMNAYFFHRAARLFEIDIALLEYLYMFVGRVRFIFAVKTRGLVLCKDWV